MSTPGERQVHVAELIRDLWPHRMSNKAAELIEDYYQGEIKQAREAAVSSPSFVDAVTDAIDPVYRKPPLADLVIDADDAHIIAIADAAVEATREWLLE